VEIRVVVGWLRVFVYGRSDTGTVVDEGFAGCRVPGESEAVDVVEAVAEGYFILGCFFAWDVGDQFW
jgi:hypothetical protein